MELHKILRTMLFTIRHKHNMVDSSSPPPPPSFSRLTLVQGYEVQQQSSAYVYDPQQPQMYNVVSSSLP
eukprot:765539-Hanusia_phi.AAC.6